MKPSKMANEDATLCSYTPMNAKKIDLTPISYGDQKMRTRRVIAFGCVACILLAFADESALCNGGRGKSKYYLTRTTFSGGRVSFHSVIDDTLFHLLSLKEKYSVVRLEVENHSQNVLPLSREKDRVELRFGDRTIPGLLDLSGHDPILWNTLDVDLRKTLAYPKTIEPGEMESVYIFGSSGFSVGNAIVYNGSEEDWSHARYRTLPLSSGY